MDLEGWIKGIAESMPIEMFAAFGGALEEIIAPIPSPLIMMTAGSLASVQHQPFAYLFWISFLGAVGKTAGAWVLYFAAMKAEHLVLNRFGAFLGITEAQIDRLSARLNKGWKDDVTLSFLRALPFMPSSILSAGCGLLKVRLRTFIVSSMIGNYIRNMIFLYIGYAGSSSYNDFLQGLDSAESVAKIVILGALAGLVAWVYLKRNRKTSGPG